MSFYVSSHVYTSFLRQLTKYSSSEAPPMLSIKLRGLPKGEGASRSLPTLVGGVLCPDMPRFDMLDKRKRDNQRSQSTLSNSCLYCDESFFSCCFDGCNQKRKRIKSLKFLLLFFLFLLSFFSFFGQIS